MTIRFNQPQIQHLLGMPLQLINQVFCIIKRIDTYLPLIQPHNQIPLPHSKAHRRQLIIHRRQIRNSQYLPLITNIHNLDVRHTPNRQ